MNIIITYIAVAFIG